MPNSNQHRPLQVPLRALMLCAAFAVLAYVALLATCSPSGFPTSMVSSSHWPFLIDKPVGEDGYYMLTVADNIATKGHVVYNRGAWATGIQPLATVLFALLDWIVKVFHGSSAALIRSVMLLGAALFVVLAWQLSRIAAMLAPPSLRRYAAVLAFLLTIFSFTLFRLFTYGLETGIYLILIAACFQITLRIAVRGRTSVQDMLLLGLAAGCAGEARIDFGLMFAVLLGVLLAYRWVSWGKALGSGAMALLLVSPWFWFVHRVSGSWLPSSGKAESTLVTQHVFAQRAGTMLIAVAGEVMPWCYGVVSHVTVLIAILSAAAIVGLLAYRQDLRQSLRGLLLSRHSMVWLAGLVTLVAIYVALFNATHFYYRYVAPLAVLTVPACAVVLAHSGWVRRHIVTVGLVLAMVFACWAGGSLHTGHLGNSQTISAGYIRKNFPTAHVGSFQSGVVGFFNHNVDNLDGKLNQGALEASARHQLPAFIDSEHINVLVDWPSVVHANLPESYLEQEWMPCPIPMVGDGESICLLRRSVADILVTHATGTWLPSAVRYRPSATQRSFF